MRPSGRPRRSKQTELDASLLDRRKVLQCLDEVRGSPSLPQEEMNDLAQLLSQLGKVVPTTLLHLLETEQDRVVVELAIRTLEWMVQTGRFEQERCVAALQRLILCETVTDQTRIQLLVALNGLGADVSDSRYAAAFKDFAAVAEASREEVLSEIAADEALLSQLLEEIGHLPSDARVAMVEDYAQSPQPIVLRLYRILGRSDDALLGQSVVECLLEKATPAAAGVLQGLRTESLCPATRERAAKAIKNLRFRGVRASNSRPPSLGTPYSTLVSALDGAGSRMIWIARSTRYSTRLFVIHLMINELHGIKDCFGSTQMPRWEYDEHVRAIRHPEGFDFEEFDYEYCLELIRDALETNHRLQCPVAPQFLLLLEIFGKDDLEPRRYKPSFPSIDLDSLREKPALLHRAVQALDLPALSSWFLITAPIYEMARRANRLTEPGSGRAAFATDVKEHLIRMCRQIIRTEIVPQASLIRRRLELMADYFTRSGCCSRDHLLGLLSAAQHLPASPSEEGIPMWPEDAMPAEENPFLLALAHRSLENAQIALRMGHDIFESRQEQE